MEKNSEKNMKNCVLESTFFFFCRFACFKENGAGFSDGSEKILGEKTRKCSSRVATNGGEGTIVHACGQRWWHSHSKRQLLKVLRLLNYRIQVGTKAALRILKYVQPKKMLHFFWGEGRTDVFVSKILTFNFLTGIAEK